MTSRESVAASRTKPPESAAVGEVYEFAAAPAGYPAARGNRYEIYDEDHGVLIGRNLTDPDGVDVHGSPEAWPRAARRVSGGREP